MKKYTKEELKQLAKSIIEGGGFEITEDELEQAAQNKLRRAEKEKEHIFAGELEVAGLEV